MGIDSLSLHHTCKMVWQKHKSCSILMADAMRFCVSKPVLHCASASLSCAITQLRRERKHVARFQQATTSRLHNRVRLNLACVSMLSGGLAHAIRSGTVGSHRWVQLDWKHMALLSLRLRYQRWHPALQRPAEIQRADEPCKKLQEARMVFT